METISKKIATIHSEFKNSLPASAIITKDIKGTSDEEEACKRLQSLGLTSSKTYQIMVSKVSHLGREKKYNSVIDKLREIETKFPEYRLIGFKKVLELCDKYSLYVGMIADFIGTIPNKNAMEMEKHMKTVSDHRIGLKINNIDDLLTGNRKTVGSGSYVIAAPRKDFKPELTEIGRSLQNIERPRFSLDFNMAVPNLMPDPIIMYPLSIDGVCVLQIATAWGDEADDDYVTNEIKVEKNNN